MKTSHPGKSNVHLPASASISQPGGVLNGHKCVCVSLCVCVAWPCCADTPPLQAAAVMVKRAEKCPHCDSYFLKNSSEYQRHIWAHQGTLFKPLPLPLLLFVPLDMQSHRDDTDALLAHIGVNKEHFSSKLTYDLSLHLSFPLTGCHPGGRSRLQAGCRRHRKKLAR